MFPDRCSQLWLRFPSSMGPTYNSSGNLLSVAAVLAWQEEVHSLLGMPCPYRSLESEGTVAG